MELNPVISTEDSLELLLPEQKEAGVYSISLENLNKNYPIEVYLIVSNDKLITLPYQSDLSISIPRRTSKFFETYLPNKGIFTLEVLECFGAVKLGRAKSYSKLIKGGKGLEEFVGLTVHII